MSTPPLPRPPEDRVVAPRLKAGDRVLDRRSGQAVTVVSVEQEMRWVFGRPKRRWWAVVECPDGSRTTRDPIRDLCHTPLGGSPT